MQNVTEGDKVAPFKMYPEPETIWEGSLGAQGEMGVFRAIYGRYHRADRMTKQLILNEFCLTTKYHRKYAIRILNGPPPGKRPARRERRRLSHGHELLSVLTNVWEAAGYPWSVRLKALLPAWLPWIRKRFKISPAIEKQLLAISPRQMDRRLVAKKNQKRRKDLRAHQAGYMSNGATWIATVTFSNGLTRHKTVLWP